MADDAKSTEPLVAYRDAISEMRAAEDRFGELIRTVEKLVGMGALGTAPGRRISMEEASGEAVDPESLAERWKGVGIHARQKITKKITSVVGDNLEVSSSEWPTYEKLQDTLTTWRATQTKAEQIWKKLGPQDKKMVIGGPGKFSGRFISAFTRAEPPNR